MSYEGLFKWRTQQSKSYFIAINTATFFGPNRGTSDSTQLNESSLCRRRQPIMQTDLNFSIMHMSKQYHAPQWRGNQSSSNSSRSHDPFSDGKHLVVYCSLNTAQHKKKDRSTLVRMDQHSGITSDEGIYLQQWSMLVKRACAQFEKQMPVKIMRSSNTYGEMRAHFVCLWSNSLISISRVEMVKYLV